MRRELPSLQICVGYFMTIVPVSGALMIVYVRARLLSSGGPPARRRRRSKRLPAGRREYGFAGDS